MRASSEPSWLERGSRSPPIRCTTRWPCHDRGCRDSPATAWNQSRGTSGLTPPGLTALADSLLVKEIWLRLLGHRELDRATSFRMFDARNRTALPEGWEQLEQVVARGSVVRIEYEGGSRGTALRSVTPRRLESRGGSAFLVAYCHLDSIEKSFRVDRILAVEYTSETGLEVVRVERRAGVR